LLFSIGDTKTGVSGAPLHLPRLKSRPVGALREHPPAYIKLTVVEYRHFHGRRRDTRSYRAISSDIIRPCLS
jgi:hypothetical protein